MERFSEVAYMKKLLTILCMAACLFSTTIQSFAADDVKNSEAYTNYGSNFDSLVQQLVGYSDEELEELKNTTTSAEDVQLIESWTAVKDDLGAYIGVLECEVEESTSELTVTMKFDFTNRDITMVYSANSESANITFDKVLTKMEILKKAGLNTLIGMGTTFIILIFISLLISTFSFIPKLFGNKKTDKTESVEEKKVELPVETAAEELTDDLELVAVITAAIAAAEGTSADGVVIRSIKRADNAKWKKA